MVCNCRCNLIIINKNTVLLLLLSFNITEETHFICLVYISCSSTFIANVYFIYELLFGSEVNDISRWKQRWPVKATVLPEHFRNPDIVPKGLHSISSRGTIESFYDFTTTIVFEGSPEDVRAFEHLVAESSAPGLIITPELFKNRVYSYEANSIFLKGDIQSTYDFLTEDYTKWNLFVWLLYGRQLAGGYYQLERVPTYGYTVYVMHRESGIDPYVIYFLFSPDRTRVVLYDFIVTH